VRVQFAAHREVVTGRDLILGMLFELECGPMHCGKAPAKASAVALTSREREVVGADRAGASPAQRAAQLFISDATAKTHLDGRDPASITRSSTVLVRFPILHFPW
jgi:DNA-binding NarL/FixJ family response regulator